MNSSQPFEGVDSKLMWRLRWAGCVDSAEHRFPALEVGVGAQKYLTTVCAGAAMVSRLFAAKVRMNGPWVFEWKAVSGWWDCR